MTKGGPWFRILAYMDVSLSDFLEDVLPFSLSFVVVFCCCLLLLLLLLLFVFLAQNFTKKPFAIPQEGIIGSLLRSCSGLLTFATFYEEDELVLQG